MKRIIELHRSLQEAGHDAGPDTIAAHLERQRGASPAVSTIWKILTRHGLVIAEPKKRPRSSYLRFEADLPNETWQSDFTHWRLASGEGTEILTFLDDHSRLERTYHRRRRQRGLGKLTPIEFETIEMASKSA